MLLPLLLAQLTKPVFEMLDRVTAISTNDLANARELIANVSSTVQKMSDSIQSATVDKIDNFQTSYLGEATNSSAQAAGSSSSTGNLVKAVHAVYYVSAWGTSQLLRRSQQAATLRNEQRQHPASCNLFTQHTAFFTTVLCCACAVPVCCRLSWALMLLSLD